MTPKLKILSNVLQRLEKLKDKATGRLYGVICDKTLIVVSFSINHEDENEPITSYNDLQLSMPVEVDFCGVLLVGDVEGNIPDAFKDIECTDNPLLIKYPLNGTAAQPFFYVHQKLKEAGPLEVIREDALYQDFVYCRLQAYLPLVAQRKNICEVAQQYRKKIAAGRVTFSFPNSNKFILGNESEAREEVTLKQLLFNPGDTSETTKSRTKLPSALIDAIPVNLYLELSKSKSSELNTRYAPILQHLKHQDEFVSSEFQIDIVSLVSYSISISRLYTVLVESAIRSLRQIESRLEEQMMKDKTLLEVPESVHFKPRGCGHLFTLVYPISEDETDSKIVRMSMHKSLALDTTRPYFRRENKVKFLNEVKENDPLYNPHEALQALPGTTIVVQGSYLYCHYMQDDFNDNGWGCAYRSLQTIFSWYRLQGYTDKPIPTHRDIQKCLVDIGDKPMSFIGSKQWIGSMEVGFVLETLLGLDSGTKVLQASTGEEMVSLIPGLAHHFETQGSPVMIGGGVLAHTIIGVNYSDESDPKFLILDPHYTGSENLHTITSKGWCNWKTKDFWKKDAFYNLCLPQRPFAI